VFQPFATASLDRLRLWIHAFFVVGTVLRICSTAMRPSPQLKLFDTTSLSSGIVIVDYRISTER
jgi:hypothetical protein